MSETSGWVAADEASLRWIRKIATNDRGVGFLVEPMPDQVFVLHPIFERVDGKPVLGRSPNHSSDDEAPLQFLHHDGI